MTNTDQQTLPDPTALTDLLRHVIGSTLGMVAADALAIIVGTVLARRLPERTVKIGAAALFVLFGLALIVEGLL